MDTEEINSMITEYLKPIDREIKCWIGITEKTNYPKLGFDTIKPTIELASLDEYPPIFTEYDHLIPITKTEYGGLQIGKILTLKTPKTATDEAKEKERAIYN